MTSTRIMAHIHGDENWTTDATPNVTADGRQFLSFGIDSAATSFTAFCNTPEQAEHLARQLAHSVHDIQRWAESQRADAA